MANMETVPFEPIREDWGDYVLPNGIQVRARVLLSFIWRDQDDDHKNEVKSGVHVAASVPKDLWGEPTEGPTRFDESTRRESFPAEEIEIRRDAQSLYMLHEGHIVRMTLRPRAVHLHDVYSKNGEPIVELQSDTEFVVSAPLPPDEGAGAEKRAKTRAKRSD